MKTTTRLGARCNCRDCRLSSQRIRKVETAAIVTMLAVIVAAYLAMAVR